MLDGRAFFDPPGAIAIGHEYYIYNYMKRYDAVGAPPSWCEGGSWVSCCLVFPMPKGLKRYYGRGHLHFLTFSCYRRLPLLATAQARQLFVRELARVRAEYGFLLVGYVVMPEHVHLLISEPKKGTPSTVLQMLKQRVSQKMRQKRRNAREELVQLASPEPGKIRVPSGSRVFMISTCTQTGRNERSWSTCTATR